MKKEGFEVSTQGIYVFEKHEVPKEFNNIKFSETDLELLRRGECTRVHKFVLDNQNQEESQYLPQGKFQLFRTAEGEIKFNILPMCEKLNIPKKIMDKELNPEEIERLKGGEFIQIKDKKTKINFYVQVDPELNMIVVKSEKTLNIPNEMLGYKFTDIEKEKLANSELLPERIYRNKDGKYLMAQITFSEDRKSIIFKNVTELSKSKAEELIPKVNTESHKLEGIVSTGIGLIDTLIQKPIEQAVKDREFQNINRNNYSDTELSKIPALIKENGYSNDEKNLLISILDKETKDVIARLNPSGKSEEKKISDKAELLGVKPNIEKSEIEKKQEKVVSGKAELLGDKPNMEQRIGRGQRQGNRNEKKELEGYVFQKGLFIKEEITQHKSVNGKDQKDKKPSKGMEI